MKKYIPLIIIFGIDLFFSTSTLLGYKYQGKESSSIYIIYNIILFVISLFLIFNELILKKSKCNRNQLILLTVPFIALFFYLLTVLFSAHSSLTTTRFLYFILWGLPSLYMGIYLSNNKDRINNIGKLMDVVMLILSLSTLINTIDSISNGTRVSVGGATYQNASYMAAYAFGINLYYIFYGNNHSRFKFTTNKLYKVVCILLLIVQFIGVLSSGGRGGFILIVIYILYITISIIYKKNRVNSLKYILLMGVAILSITIVLPKLMQISIFNNSVERVLSYLSPEGIDMSRTSGRDLVYGSAIELIKQSPIIGYGIFGFWKIYGAYPHNLFLEILLQGGVVMLFISIIIIILLLRRIIYMVRYNEELRIILIIFLYPITMLMFSGTYTNNSIFWFCISFIFSYRLEKCINS